MAAVVAVVAVVYVVEVMVAVFEVVVVVAVAGWATFLLSLARSLPHSSLSHLRLYIRDFLCLVRASAEIKCLPVSTQ